MGRDVEYGALGRTVWGRNDHERQRRIVMFTARARVDLVADSWCQLHVSERVDQRVVPFYVNLIVSAVWKLLNEG